MKELLADFATVVLLITVVAASYVLPTIFPTFLQL